MRVGVVQVQLHGGRQDARLAAGTTHVVLVPGVTGRWEPSPAELLEALWKEKGGVPGLSALRRGLQAGSVHVVRSRCAPEGARSAPMSDFLAACAGGPWPR